MALICPESAVDQGGQSRRTARTPFSNKRRGVGQIGVVSKENFSDQLPLLLGGQEWFRPGDQFLQAARLFVKALSLHQFGLGKLEAEESAVELLESAAEPDAEIEALGLDGNELLLQPGELTPGALDGPADQAPPSSRTSPKTAVRRGTGRSKRVIRQIPAVAQNVPFIMSCLRPPDPKRGAKRPVYAGVSILAHQPLKTIETAS